MDLLIFLGAVAFTDEGMQEHFRVSPFMMQKYAPFVLFFSERREGGSFFQALQEHDGMQNSISFSLGITACRLERSGYSSVLVV
jgi:hypothetical protein